VASPAALIASYVAPPAANTTINAINPSRTVLSSARYAAAALQCWDVRTGHGAGLRWILDSAITLALPAVHGLGSGQVIYRSDFWWFDSRTSTVCVTRPRSANTSLALLSEVIAMTAISIRNLDPEVKSRLRVRAAGHGRSMEAEIRAILSEAVAGQRPGSFFDALRAISLEHGGVDLDLRRQQRRQRSVDLG
jgi:antitoxin FitA